MARNLATPNQWRTQAVCRTCPVMETCLKWAMDSGQQAGIWGGTTEKERENLRRRRNRAAARSQQAEATQTAPTCGTTAAYYQHLMAGEAIDAACQAASDGFEQQLTPPPGPPECGTRGGYQKHGRDGTEICTPCRQANTDADRNLRNTGTTLAAA